MSVTTAIVLDTRAPRARSKKPKEIPKNDKNRACPVCIRVTYQRDHRLYPIGIQLSRADFRKLSSPHLGEKLRETKENTEKEQRRAENIIKNLRIFSFGAFSEQFRCFQQGSRRKQEPGQLAVNTCTAIGSAEIPGGNKKQKRANFINQFGRRKYPRKKSEIDFAGLGEVAVYYGIYIIKLEAKEQVTTVGIYLSSLMNLLRYHPNLRFADVTDLWLYQYEKHMKDLGRSVTTISIYLRCLRRIFNMVVRKKIIDRDSYPFGQDLYVMPAARKRKKALKMPDIQTLFHYQSIDPVRQMCKDLWFFMYVGNGMNPKDMCLLQFGKISDRFCRFLRAKTINTTRENQQEIAFFCDDFILGVIARWGNPDQSPDNYIFPFLEPGMDAYAIRDKVQLVAHLINKHMYAIANEVNISLLPGNKDARRAFATQLKRAGKPTEFIRELMGHQDEKTTQAYLDDFEDETKMGNTGTLLPFYGGEGLSSVNVPQTADRMLMTAGVTA